MTQSAQEMWPLDEVNVGTGLPLEGIRILDLSQVLAAPLATMIAADLGADVIKIEPPGGDLVRGFAPPSIDGVATYYLAVNRNCRSIVADLRSQQGQALVRRLMACADGVVENYLPSRAIALGIDQMKAEFTDVVWVTVAPAAKGGPLGDEPSFDLLAQARSGLMGVTGSTDSGPMKVGAPLADVVTGLYACIGLLTGLFGRLRHADRPAIRIEAPLLESTIASLINQAAGFLASGDAPAPLGNDHPNIVPYATYATEDLDILLAVGTDSQFRNLCLALGSEALGKDPRFAMNVDRVTNRDDLRRVLEEVMATKGSGEWLERLAAHSVPCAPVNDVSSAMAQEQVAKGDLLVDVVLESGSTVPMVASPLRLDGVRPAIRKAPPTPGQHTEEFLNRMERS